MRIRLGGRRGSGKPMGRRGKLFFGIVWTLFSSIFVAVGLGLAWKQARVGTWDRVSCEIERFEIADDPDASPPFTVDLVFRYRVDGTWRRGTRLRAEETSGGNEYEKLAALREEWPSGRPTCRVNPADPDDAVLLADRGQFGFGLIFAGFGGCFMLVGIGLVASSLRQGPKAAPSSQNELGGAVGLGVFGLFAAGGIGMFFGLVVPKALEYFEMRDWVETPAEVLWSRVRSHTDSDGTTYSTDVFYRYEFGGREFRSNRRGLIGGSSSGRASKQRYVDERPPDTGVTCYVDPERPWRAVLEREVGWAGLFVLFPLPFAAVGLGGLWWMFFGAAAKRRRSASGRLPGTRLP